MTRIAAAAALDALAAGEEPRRGNVISGALVLQTLYAASSSQSLAVPMWPQHNALSSCLGGSLAVGDAPPPRPRHLVGEAFQRFRTDFHSIEVAFVARVRKRRTL